VNDALLELVASGINGSFASGAAETLVGLALGGGEGGGLGTDLEEAGDSSGVGGCFRSFGALGSCEGEGRGGLGGRCVCHNGGGDVSRSCGELCSKNGLIFPPSKISLKKNRFQTSSLRHQTDRLCGEKKGENRRARSHPKKKPKHPSRTTVQTQNSTMGHLVSRSTLVRCR